MSHMPQAAPELLLAMTFAKIVPAVVIAVLEQAGYADAWVVNAAGLIISQGHGHQTYLLVPPSFCRLQVWVCGMPHEYSEDDIRAYWGGCGEVESLELLTFKVGTRGPDVLCLPCDSRPQHTACSEELPQSGWRIAACNPLGASGLHTYMWVCSAGQWALQRCTVHHLQDRGGAGWMMSPNEQ
jgi:hypothetical protein